MCTSTTTERQAKFPESWFYIKNQASSLVLDIEGDKFVTATLKNKDYESQLWKFNEGTLINKKRDLVLAVNMGNLKLSTQWSAKGAEESINQQFGLTPEGHIYAISMPTLVLGFKEGIFGWNEGARVKLQLQYKMDEKEQRWDFIVPNFNKTEKEADAGPVKSLTPETAANIEGTFPDDFFYIMSQESGLLLGVEGGSTVAGGKLTVDTMRPKDHNSQLWQFWDGMLINKKSGLALDLEKGSTASGSQICQNTVTEEPSQQWGLTIEGYIYTKGNDHLVLGIKESWFWFSSREGSHVYLLDKKDVDHKEQLWNFVMLVFKKTAGVSSSTQNLPRRQSYQEITAITTREGVAVLGGIAVATEIVKDVVSKDKRPSEPLTLTAPSSPNSRRVSYAGEETLLTTPPIAAAEEEELPDGFRSITSYKNVQNADEFPKEWFFIKSTLHGFVFDVQNSSTHAGAKVVLTRLRSKDYASQLWAYRNGYIINLKSRLVIDVPADDKGSYWPLIQNPAKTGDRVLQRWGVNPEKYIFSLTQKSLSLTLKDLDMGGKTSLEIFLTEAKPSKEHREQRTECRWIFLVPVFAKGNGTRKPSTSIPSSTVAGATTISVVDSELIEGSTSGKQKEMARAALEMPLIKQDIIQVEPIKNQYLQRYKIAELDAIHRQHLSVGITIRALSHTTTQMSKRSRASGTSATSLIHDSISLKGPLKDVTKARDAVEALLDSIDVQQVDVVYPIAQEILAFRRFKSLAGSIRTRRNVVMEYFRKSATCDNVTIHIVASGGAGVVQKTLEKFAAVRFCSETFKIPEGQHYPVGKQSKPFKRLILNDFNVFLNFRRDRVVELIGETDEILASAKSRIETLLENESASRSYTFSDVRYRLWFEKRKDENKIVMIAKQHNVWINPERNDDCLSYKISGARNTIDKAFTSFKTYADKVISELQWSPVRVDRRQAEIILMQKDKVRKIEQNHCVEILLPKADFSVVIRATNQAIELVCGDIVHEAVDAIVNSTNGKLDHGCGIAKVIANAAGQQLHDECKNYIAQYGSMSTGNAFVTTAGDLQKKGVKYVIHVVVPVWSSGTNKEEEHLHVAITNALLQADAKGCKTVALPLIGTGLSGFPHEKGVNIIVDAVVRILPKTQIHKVRIIDFKLEQVVKGTPAKDIDDVGVKDANQQNRKEVYPMLRKVLSERWKEIENDEIATGPGDSSVLARPTLQPLPYQRFWMKDAGGKNPTPVDYKYWKELVEFVIMGTRVDTAAAAKELKSLANLKTEFIHMMGPWEKIDPEEREATLRMIAGRLHVDVEFHAKKDTIELTGHDGFVDTVLTEVYKWALDKAANIENDVPKDWDKFDEKVNCVLVALSATSEEWKKVVAHVNQTMPHACIQKIERIQNRHMWSTYQYNRRQLSKKNVGQINVSSLFHGTRSTLPSDIYESEEGFDPRFSAQGMWGKGCYFAVNASYSNDYAFVSRGSKQFFLADVITGDSITLPPNNSITIPPAKARQSGKFKNERYDSINGNTNGSNIYIVYSPGRFYPTYLITYK